MPALLIDNEISGAEAIIASPAPATASDDRFRLLRHNSFSRFLKVSGLVYD